MQQGGTSGGGEMKHNQDRRLKQMQSDQNQLQHPPQKCPRCDSLYTKFCYYNNYSLSQPRYFCKTCRRYWTQGGTLRNVPVGGGCRKGKLTKGSSSSSSASCGENSRSQSSQPPQQQQQNLANPQNFTSSTGPGSTAKVSPTGISVMGSYNNAHGGGFLSSLAAIQSLNNQPPPPPPPPPFTYQPLSLGGGGVADGTGSSSLGLLPGFNVVSPFGSQQQRQFYHLGPHEESLIHSGRPACTTSQLQNWHQGFVTNTNPSVSDTALWSISTSTTTGNTANRNTTTAAGGSSLNPDHHQWHDLPGYGPPP